MTISAKIRTDHRYDSSNLSAPARQNREINAEKNSVDVLAYQPILSFMASWIDEVIRQAPAMAAAFQLEVQFPGKEPAYLPECMIKMPPKEYPNGVPFGIHRIIYFNGSSQQIPSPKPIWVKVQPDIEVEPDEADSEPEDTEEDDSDDMPPRSQAAQRTDKAASVKESGKPAVPSVIDMEAELRKVSIAHEAERDELKSDKERAYTEEITEWHTLNRKLRADVLHMHKILMEGHDSLAKAYANVIALQSTTITGLSQQLKSLQQPPAPPDYSSAVEATIYAVKDIGVALIGKYSDKKQIASEAGLASKSLSTASADVSTDEIKKFVAGLDDLSIAQMLQSPDHFKEVIVGLRNKLSNKSEGK